MTDTGPPYPIPPGAGSNAIGSFKIGVSQIGDIPAFDIWETIISQYANSPALTTLLTNFASYIDPTANLQSFFDLIMNVDTAQGYGLDVWGRIVGIARTLTVPTPFDSFGFAEGRPSWQGFNVAPFYFGTPASQTYILPDTAYLKLILAKALSNICNGSIPAINQILINLFVTEGRGNAYVTEGTQITPFFGFAESTTAVGFNQGQFYDGSPSFEDMIMTYTFRFQLTPLELAIVQYSNVLPKSTGVRAAIVQIY